MDRPEPQDGFEFTPTPEDWADYEKWLDSEESNDLEEANLELQVCE